MRNYGNRRRRRKGNGTGPCSESSMVKMGFIAEDKGEVSGWILDKGRAGWSDVISGIVTGEESVRLLRVIRY